MTITNISPISVTEFSDTVHRVREGATTVGFVRVCDTVYVSLLGENYSKAVEIGQSLDLPTAVAMLSQTHL
ncbi:MAG TPA: hypothetical protein VNT53_11025 [Pseudolysinimonas sp.]|nr:hypothetical protein [Pseudolysinimonas sp.]